MGIRRLFSYGITHGIKASQNAKRPLCRRINLRFSYTVVVILGKGLFQFQAKFETFFQEQRTSHANMATWLGRIKDDDSTLKEDFARAPGHSGRPRLGQSLVRQ